MDRDLAYLLKLILTMFKSFRKERMDVIDFITRIVYEARVLQQKYGEKEIDKALEKYKGKQF